MLSVFIPFAIFLFFWNISPGPMVALASRYSVKYSFKGGLAITCGILICDIIYLTLAFLGVSNFIAKNEQIFYYASILGGIYILYIGISIIKEASKSKEDFTKGKVISHFNFGKIVWRGFLTNLSNPLTIVGMTSFILPFFKQAVTLEQKFLFAFLIPFSTFYCFMLISFLFGNPIIRKLILSKMMWFERIAGCVICYMAISIIFFQ